MCRLVQFFFRSRGDDHSDSGADGGERFAAHAKNPCGLWLVVCVRRADEFSFSLMWSRGLDCCPLCFEVSSCDPPVRSSTWVLLQVRLTEEILQMTRKGRLSRRVCRSVSSGPLPPSMQCWFALLRVSLHARNIASQHCVFLGGGGQDKITIVL